MEKIIKNVLSAFFTACIRLYQYAVSPLMRPSCRYWPTCSEYAAQAIKQYGPFKGLYLAIKRIMRCHPWGGCGCDPIP